MSTAAGDVNCTQLFYECARRCEGAALCMGVGFAAGSGPGSRPPPPAVQHRFPPPPLPVTCVEEDCDPTYPVFVGGGVCSNPRFCTAQQCCRKGEQSSLVPCFNFCEAVLCTRLLIDNVEWRGRRRECFNFGHTSENTELGPAYSSDDIPPNFLPGSFGHLESSHPLFLETPSISFGKQDACTHLHTPISALGDFQVRLHAKIPQRLFLSLLVKHQICLGGNGTISLQPDEAIFGYSRRTVKNSSHEEVQLHYVVCKST